MRLRRFPAATSRGMKAHRPGSRRFAYILIPLRDHQLETG